jgi:hypothetical protein
VVPTSSPPEKSIAVAESSFDVVLPRTLRDGAAAVRVSTDPRVRRRAAKRLRRRGAAWASSACGAADAGAAGAGAGAGAPIAIGGIETGGIAIGGIETGGIETGADEAAAPPRIPAALEGITKVGPAEAGASAVTGGFESDPRSRSRSSRRDVAGGSE